jgi:DNA polymerase III subunit epsilon
VLYAYVWRAQVEKLYTRDMQERPLVFVDVETTGGMASSSRILEIGALRVEDGNVVAKMKQVLDPEEPVPSWITRLTGIEQAETGGKPKFAQVFPGLQVLFQDAIFVAHNVTFDYSFFKAEYSRLGHKFNMDKFCTVRLSRALYPYERSHKLDAVIARHGYRVKNRHRAYDDAEVLLRFYRDSFELFGADRVEPIITRLVAGGQSRLFM